MFIAGTPIAYVQASGNAGIQVSPIININGGNAEAHMGCATYPLYQENHMKENQHVKPVINVEAGTVTFQIKGHDDVVFDIAKASEANNRRAALTGYAQVRIVDRAAVGMTDDDGNLLSEEERIALKAERIAELVSHLHTGTSDWNIRSAGIGGGKSITIEAVAQIKGMEYDVAKAEIEKYAEAKFGGDTKKALAKLREGRQVMEAIAKIKAARLPAPKADADAMLAELGK